MALEREGGRGANQLRPIDCTRNILSRAQGSASCSHDAGIPLKYLAVAISCCIAENGQIILDPSKLEEQKMKAFVCLAFPGSARSVVPEESANGIITSVTRGVMAVDDYLQCIEQGRAAITPLSNILKKKLQSQASE
ncbi:ribosomal protein S5 domain 2-like superfamily protein [Striga asiatica]|uniref:Ribosomal protein S5 domain 2-like superfamily protein n=1 Tax=Striga asiatica TaxID=4170 RepID=A0A5A7RDI4_STRAF|nr:ribosomal protein S5 domain 2-like superfamily protein [Striga asiatica]